MPSWSVNPCYAGWVSFLSFHLYESLRCGAVLCTFVLNLDFLESFSIFVVTGILVVHFSIIYNIRVQYVFVRNGYKAVSDSLVEED
jgi:hypothetical protein